MSQNIHLVERTLHILITEDYLLAKFLNQLEMIEWWAEQERLEQERKQFR